MSKDEFINNDNDNNPANQAFIYSRFQDDDQSQGQNNNNQNGENKDRLFPFFKNSDNRGNNNRKRKNSNDSMQAQLDNNGSNKDDDQFFQQHQQYGGYAGYGDENGIDNIIGPIQHRNNQQTQVQKDIIQDLFLNNTKPTNNHSSQGQKKQVSLQQSLNQVEKKISESSSIESKITGLKILSQKIRQNKLKKSNMQFLCNWLEATNLVNIFIHEDVHPQILRNMGPILKFLYENQKINMEWICIFVFYALKSSHEEYIKLLQFLINFVNIQDLYSIYQIIQQEHDLQNHNLSALLSTIVSNKYFTQQPRPQKQKYSTKNKISQQPEKNNTLIQFQNQQNLITEPFLHSMQAQKDKQLELQQQFSKQNIKINNLTLNLFKFLIEATDRHMNTYYPILNKLITSKHVLLEQELFLVLPQLLKKQKINAIWILQHCLKIDFGQTAINNSNKQKKSNNQARFNFINKLVNQHLYEYLLIILSKVRFNKLVVDKILNIVILLSKNYRPLDENYTKYIWKILGLHSKQQKQREQFFIFVKDILRNQSNFTEESVHFIFFQVLMGLSADWFSLKILDCLEMLFMRLNQDLKLISYTDQTYLIQDPDLVGIDKFWYIYFNSNDVKVTKKCKDFLWKLVTYNSNNQIKIKFLKQYINKIIYFMSETQPELKTQFCQKGFDIIDKMMQQTQRKQPTTSAELQLIVMNQCRQAMGGRKIHLKLSQKCSLSYLKQVISQNITPKNTSIKLICQGKILKNQKKILKQLGIKNNNTIMVTDLEQLSKEENQQIKNQWVEKVVVELIQIFGGAYENDLIKFVASKMEGNTIQAISDTIVDTDKMNCMMQQYQQSKKKNSLKQKAKQQSQKQKQNGQQQYQIIHSNQMQDENNKNGNKNIIEQQQPKQQKQQKQQPQIQIANFSNILISNQNHIRELLICASESNKKRGWQTIKNLPKPSIYLYQINKNCEQSNWSTLFPKQEVNQMICIYNAHLLKHILETEPQKIKIYLFCNGGFDYLIDWVRRLPEGSSSIVIQQVTNLIVLALEEDCYKLGLFKQRVTKKKQHMLLSELISQNQLTLQTKQSQFTKYGDESFFNWLLYILLNEQKNNRNAILIQNIVEIMIYFIFESEQILLKILEEQVYEVFFIVQSHGFVGEYIFLVALSKLFVEFQEGLRLNYCRKFLQLSEYCFDFKNQKNNTPKMVYIYDLIACILDKITQHTQVEIQITFKCIQTVKQQIENLSSEQLIAILQLLKLCFKLSKQNGNNDSLDKINQIGGSFSRWLINKFLFYIEKPSKHIRNKQIRKICYQVLKNISDTSAENTEIIVNQILKIQVKNTSKQDDFIQYRTQQYIGLTNLGATCYINSLLQQIYHTKFSKLLLEKGDKQSQQAQLMRQLKQIFMQLCYSIKNVVNPKQFIKTMNFYGEPINPFVQQDATQFLLSLFDHIQGNGCKQEVYDVFGGHLCNQITVQVQQGVNDQPVIKNNTQHFNSLSLDIKGKKNLQQALAYLIKPQTLDGQNKYFCQQFHKKMKASKKCYIQSMPNILILTLKRFQYDLDSHTRHKLNDYFEFPLQLDMHKYSAAFLRNKQQTSQSKYKLAGILVHSGSAESGHYYSYIKIGEQWYQFNDRMVSEFNFANNLKNQCFGCTEGKKTRNAYILFYQKAHTNYHGVYLSQIPESNIYKKKINQENQIFLKSRLIYDDNFKKFLQDVQKNTNNSSLMKFIDATFNSKNNKKVQNKREQGAATAQPKVHFDADEEKKPLKVDDEFF